MPIYTYRCKTCNKPQEVIHSHSSVKKPECCGEKMKRVPSLVAGWKVMGKDWGRDGGTFRYLSER